MGFESILFRDLNTYFINEDKIKEDNLEENEFFVDLNLDQIINSIIKDKQEEYNIKPFFYLPLNNIEDIYYRQEVMKDLENPKLYELITTFTEKMHSMRLHLHLVERLDYKYNKQGWFLEAVKDYCDAVLLISKNISLINLKSNGFLSFRKYIDNYVKSDYFISLKSRLDEIKKELLDLEYCIIIKGNRVRVQKYNYEINYSKEIEKTFEKFRQQQVKDYKFVYTTNTGMNHIEANIIDCVAKLFPDIFSKLDNFYNENYNFLDDKIKRFDCEIQFYIVYLDLIKKIRKMGLQFCYPEISDSKKEIYDIDGFDLALANKSFYENSKIVTNDFLLENKERIIIVSGPNQGGKTTFARTFGQIHYLASLGFPVPGSKAKLFLYDKIFTHFEKEESIKTLRGKLQDDLLRIQLILDKATPNSIVILNEIFTSTSLQDAIFLSKKILEKIIMLDLYCIWVTFIVELASYGSQTVSMVSTVSPENPEIRTFKIIRKEADGIAYAISIAKKYKLTKNFIDKRIKKE